MKKSQALQMFAALSQESRLDVFRLLVRHGDTGLAAGAISEKLGVPSATLSFHLKELRNAGLVHCRKDGRSRIYAPDFPAVRAVAGFLLENCCRGADDAQLRPGAGG